MLVWLFVQIKGLDELPEERIAFAGMKIDHFHDLLSMCSIDFSKLREWNIDHPSSESRQFTIIELTQERTAFIGPRGTAKTGQSGTPENRPVVDRRPGH